MPLGGGIGDDEDDASMRDTECFKVGIFHQAYPSNILTADQLSTLVAHFAVAHNRLSMAVKIKIHFEAPKIQYDTGCAYTKCIGPETLAWFMDCPKKRKTKYSIQSRSTCQEQQKNKHHDEASG